MAIPLPYPFPDPITGEWEVFAMIRNLRALSDQQFTTQPVSRGGTGISTYAVGDLLYASAATTLAKLAAVADGNVLRSAGVTTAPVWGKVRLSGATTDVTGTLPVANGGTGVTAVLKVPQFWGNSVATGAGATVYFNSSVEDATEANVNQIVPIAGTVRNLYVRTSTAQPAGGALVVTFRKGGADQTVTLTIAANAAAGNFSDTTNSFTVAAGDLIDIKAVNGDGGNPAAVIVSVAFTVDIN